MRNLQFTMFNVDGYTIYMHIGCLNCPELNYFTLGGQVDYLCSSYLSLKIDHQRFVLCLASSEIA